MTNANAIRGAARQALQNHLDYLSSGRINEWVDLFTEDGVMEFPYAPKGFPEKVAGKKALYEHMQNFPKQFSVKFTKLRYHETTDPSLVIAEFEIDGVALSTGRPYPQKCISVVETRDGAITRYVDYWNPLVAMQSMGADLTKFLE